MVTAIVTIGGLWFAVNLATMLWILERDMSSSR